MDAIETANGLTTGAGTGASARGFPHDGPADAAKQGIDPVVIERVLEQFRAQQRAGLFPGGQVAVRRHGTLVLDEAVGFARGVKPDEGVPLARVTPETRFVTFSAGKPLIAMSIAMLEERGRLDVHAPIAEVFPEFAAHGKEHITTLDVLTHRGGILMPDFIRRPRDWMDWNKVVDALCAVKPTYARGVLAYHPLEYGWVLAEVVRRVTGRELPEFLATEFTGPAELTGLKFRLAPEEVKTVARPYWLGSRSVYIGEINMAALFADLDGQPEILTSFVPGAGLVTDAAALTGFYDLLLAGGVARSGRRLLSSETIRRYTARHAIGWCRTNNAPLAVGRGFLLGMTIPSCYGWWDTKSVFGHAGAFCTVAFADPRTGLSAAFVTNGNRGPIDLVRRFTGLAGKVRAACHA